MVGTELELELAPSSSLISHEDESRAINNNSNEYNANNRNRSPDLIEDKDKENSKGTERESTNSHGADATSSQHGSEATDTKTHSTSKHSIGLSSPSVSSPSKRDQNNRQRQRHVAHNVLPTSLQLLQPFWLITCQNCNMDDFDETSDIQAEPNNNENHAGDFIQFSNLPSPSLTSSHPPPPPPPPILSSSNKYLTSQNLIAQYIYYCHMYTSPPRVNPGILTALRFSLPYLRVSADFHDADMLAFVDLMLPHCNTHLKYITRLDFSLVSKNGKDRGLKGFTSHGATSLSKILQISKHIKEVYLQRNRLGYYGANAIFTACGKNPTIQVLAVRRCLIGERGAAAFVKYCVNSPRCGLREVDLSVNRFGFVGCKLIEAALENRRNRQIVDADIDSIGVPNTTDSIDSTNTTVLENSHIDESQQEPNTGQKQFMQQQQHPLEVELEANLVFQEIMNSVTHGLGIIMCIIGSQALMYRVKHKSYTHIISCGVYSMSLLVLYTSSTLYHSFFTLLTTRYIFEIFDHCAIYILIAGSYTPFLSISLYGKPMWSIYLLAFIWLCCIMGIIVEGFFTKWKYKPTFSLTMYLAMGWCCMVCMPDLLESLSNGAIHLIIMGGVAYTSGVPFFVRNNNLDHSIWHCFVLAGSVFHWLGIYFFVATLDIPHNEHNDTIGESHDGNFSTCNHNEL